MEQMDYTTKKEDSLQQLRNLCDLRGYSVQTKKAYVFYTKRYLEFC